MKGSLVSWLLVGGPLAAALVWVLSSGSREGGGPTQPTDEREKVLPDTDEGPCGTEP